MAAVLPKSSDVFPWSIRTRSTTTQPMPAGVIVAKAYKDWEARQAVAKNQAGDASASTNAAQ